MLSLAHPLLVAYTIDRAHHDQRMRMHAAGVGYETTPRIVPEFPVLAQEGLMR